MSMREKGPINCQRERKRYRMTETEILCGKERKVLSKIKRVKEN